MDNKKCHSVIFERVLRNFDNYFWLHCDECNKAVNGKCIIYKKDLNPTLKPCVECKKDCMKHFEHIKYSCFNSQLRDSKRFIELGKTVSCKNCEHYKEVEDGEFICSLYGNKCEGDFPHIQCIEDLLQDYKENK